MRRPIRRVALAVTAVAVVAIAGGVTYAVAEIGGGGVINGCYKSPPRDDDDDDAQGVKSASRDDDDHARVSGQLRVIDPATDSCRRNETAISWNQTGPQGPKGDNGDPGPQGPPGLSGLPPIDRFTATQIVRGAILTCGSTRSDSTITVCEGGMRLNGLDILFNLPEAHAICIAVTGDGARQVSTDALAAVPYFIWNGSNWALDSTRDVRMATLTCNVSPSAAAARMIRKQPRSVARSGPTVVAGREQTRPAWTRNCTALNRRYRHGVGMPGARDKTSDEPVTNFRRSRVLYRTAMRWNRGLDRDKDRIACEKL